MVVRFLLLVAAVMVTTGSARADIPMLRTTMRPPAELPALRLSPISWAPERVCRTCGAGIPDAVVGRLRIGADSSDIVFGDSLRVYVKVTPPKILGASPAHREVQVSLDVGTSTQVVLFGSRF
jgi:hypothetical protein